MRSRSLSTKLIFVFLFLAVAAYFSVQVYRYFVDPQTTTLVYAYSSEDAIAATGYFARDEQVIACSETLLELERAEGERVNAGGTLATVYRSESALNDHRQLRALRSRLEQLRYAREASRDAETALDAVGITVNKNTIPGEQRSPFVTSGIRVGSAAATTRGFDEAECERIGELIGDVVTNLGDENVQERVAGEVKEFLQAHPLYPEL